MWKSPFILDPLSQGSSGNKSNRSVIRKIKIISDSMMTSEEVFPLFFLHIDNPQDNVCEPSCHHTRVEAEGCPGCHRKPQCCQVGQKHLLPVQNPPQQLPRGFCSIPAPGEVSLCTGATKLIGLKASSPFVPVSAQGFNVSPLARGHSVCSIIWYCIDRMLRYWNISERLGWNFLKCGRNVHEDPWMNFTDISAQNSKSLLCTLTLRIWAPLWQH